MLCPTLKSTFHHCIAEIFDCVCCHLQLMYHNQESYLTWGAYSRRLLQRHPGNVFCKPVFIFVWQAYTGDLPQFPLSTPQTIHSHLAALNKVLKSSSLLSSAMYSVANSLLHHNVPAQWCSLWEGPADPFQYLRSVVAKSIALGVWFEKHTKGHLLTNGLDLSDLFRPSAFINAVRQQTAR